MIRAGAAGASVLHLAATGEASTVDPRTVTESSAGTALTWAVVAIVYLSVGPAVMGWLARLAADGMRRLLARVLRYSAAVHHVARERRERRRVEEVLSRIYLAVPCVGDEWGY